MPASVGRGEWALPRRDVLSVLGAGGVAGVGGLAGCLDGGAGGEDVEPIRNRVTVDPEDVVRGGTLRTALQGSPDTFDYGWSSQAFANTLINLVYEGLITTSASGELYDWLASDYEQVTVQDVGPRDYEPYMSAYPFEDGVLATDAQVVVAHPDDDPAVDDEGRALTTEEAPDAVADGVYGMHLRFELHEGVRFHDGTELTASDVVASYRRIEDSRMSAQLFDSLLDVQADGDYVVDIYAQEPDAAAVRELGGWPIYPSEHAALPGGEIDPREGTTPIGTGPWQLAAFEDESHARFARNEDYWFDTSRKDWFDGPTSFPNGPVIDEVDVRFVPDPAQRSAALQNGELDLVFGLGTDSLDDYRAAEGFRAAAADGAGYEFLQYPVNVPPWDDRRLRRAVNHLIPREQIAEDVYAGWETPAWVPLPPLAASEGTTDYQQLVTDLRHYNEYDPDRAEALVEDVVADRSLEPPIEAVVETNADDPDRVRAAQLVVDSLDRSAYFDARLDPVADVNTAVQRYQDETFYEEGRLVWIGLSGGFDPHDYAAGVHHPDNHGQCCNFQRIDDPELNDLLHDARFGVDVATDRDLRRERYDAVWERILELCANAYGTHGTIVGVVDDAVVHGFNAYPSQQDLLGYPLYAPVDEQLTYLDRS